jgi:hypothetical protein
MQNKIYIAIIILLISSACLASVSTYYFYDKYEKKVSDYEELSDEHINLQGHLNLYQGIIDDLELELNSLESTYNSYKNNIEVRYGEDSDCCKFITPENPTVINKSKEILGDDFDGDLTWNDRYLINDWVHENIQYNYDTYIGDRRSCYLYPSETLNLGWGDCEDHATLMLSLSKAEEDVSWMWCASVQYYKEEKTSHICVFVNIVDDQLYIFDPTHHSEPYYDYGYGYYRHRGWRSSQAASESEALQEYAEHLSATEITVKKIFNKDKVVEFKNNQEFFDYF